MFTVLNDCIVIYSMIVYTVYTSSTDDNTNGESNTNTAMLTIHLPDLKGCSKVVMMAKMVKLIRN
jgi:hypothetical protein